MDGKQCPACALQGDENFLQTFQISSTNAVVLCPKTECGYPFMSTHEMEYVERSISEIPISEECEIRFNELLEQATEGLKRGMLDVPVPMELLPEGARNPATTSNFMKATEKIPIIIEYLPEVPHEASTEFQNCEVLSQTQNGAPMELQWSTNEQNEIVISLADEKSTEMSAVSSAYNSEQDFNSEQSVDFGFEAPPHTDYNYYPLMREPMLRGTGSGVGRVSGRRGRPRGSKNKCPPEERQPREGHTATQNTSGKRGRGRPRGSKSARGKRGGTANTCMYSLESDCWWVQPTVNKPKSVLQDYVTGNYMHQAPADLPKNYSDEELAKMDINLQFTGLNLC